MNTVEIANVPISMLCIIIFALLALFVIIRGFKLPADFFERDKLRAAMRKRLRELEETNRNEPGTSAVAPAGKAEKNSEPPAQSDKKPSAVSPANLSRK